MGCFETCYASSWSRHWTLKTGVKWASNLGAVFAFKRGGDADFTDWPS